MDISDFSPTIPWDDIRIMIEGINGDYKQLAERLINAVGPSAHRTAALRKLLESKMTLIHGLTHTG